MPAAPQPEVPPPGAVGAAARYYLEVGDNYFREGRYVDALSRYRRAARAAPQRATVHLRQGFALAAIQRYDLAAQSFEQALELEPGALRPPFHLNTLFRGDQEAKERLLDATAAAVEAAPNDVEPLYVYGVLLYCNGQLVEAEATLERVVEFLGERPQHVTALLVDVDERMERLLGG